MSVGRSMWFPAPEKRTSFNLHTVEASSENSSLAMRGFMEEDVAKLVEEFEESRGN